jgi:hypothetical protein
MQPSPNSHGRHEFKQLNWRIEMNRTPVSMMMLFLMTTLLLCGNASALTVTDTEESIRETIGQLENDFNAAILAKDQSALKRILSDDYAFGSSPNLSKTEHIDQIVSAVSPNTQTIDSMTVKLYGETAVVTGISTASWLSPKGFESKSFRWVNVWVQDESGWHVVYNQSTVVVNDSMEC